MAGKVIFAELEQFSKKLEKLSTEQTQKFNEKTLKELAARLLAKAKSRTPVYKKIPGDVNSHEGGFLRNESWAVSEVKKSGNGYTIEVINTAEYAEYVEYGHRGVYVPEVGKVLHTDKRWTDGKFMLTISSEEIESETPRILENKLNEFVRSLENG